MAQRAVKAKDFSYETVERVLARAAVPLSSTRQNVIPHGQEKVRGAVCGLAVFASHIGLSLYSKRAPWLTRLLTLFARSHHKNFPFTSIQINIDYATRPHVDKNNLGESLIIGFGPYKGGELWVHDDEGSDAFTLTEDLPNEPLYKKRSTFLGRRMDIRYQWQRFDGRRLHFTDPFTGPRTSIVYFTCDRFAETPEHVRQGLKSAGFNFCWDSARLQKMLSSKKQERAELVTRLAKERHSFHKGVVQYLRSEDQVQYQQSNPKLPGCQAHARYERYKRAKTVAEARKLGAWNIDFIYDYNWGYLTVGRLVLEPKQVDLQAVEKRQRDARSSGSEIRPTGNPNIKIRVAGMTPQHTGLEVPRGALHKLACRIPQLSQVPEEGWVAEDGPLSSLPLPVVRVFLHWALTGRLCCLSSEKRFVQSTLTAWGKQELSSELCPPDASSQPMTKKRRRA